MHVVALAGGTGAAKLLRGFATCVAPRDLTVIGNTGDDTEIWGLRISPDLDTVTYALAGLLDVERGWGLAGETFNCLAAMAAHGADTWFNLGDRDLATHLTRTRALGDGQPLSSVTAQLAADLGVAARILPMSDDPVRTTIRTPGGRLTFQEYFVREKALVEVVGVDYDGASSARPAAGVLEAIRTADVVVVCPSNPVTSIGPILAVPGIVAALRSTVAPIAIASGSSVIPCLIPCQSQVVRTISNGFEPGAEVGVRVTPLRDLFFEIGGWARVITFSDPTDRPSRARARGWRAR